MTFDINLYFSGSVGEKVYEYMIERDVCRLCTYAYPKEAPEYLNLCNRVGKRCNMMMDSGAFTAWSIGKPVQLDALIAYNQDILKTYGSHHDFVFISLDVIPGERGQRATSEQIASAVRQSYDNFRIMQQHFPHHKVMPVYHSGEDVSLRDAYLQMTDYVCLSMDQGFTETNRLEWAKRSIVPGFFFHGLAATGNKMVTQIDWYSVDSSSWLTVGSMGSLLWPTSRGTFRTLPVSTNSPARQAAGQHVDTLTASDRQAVVNALQARGFNLEQLQTDYDYRHKWNIEMWCDPPWTPALVKPMDLFS